MTVTGWCVQLQASERRQRGPSRSRLEASSSTVLEFLGQLPVLSLSGLRCYSSWSQLGFNDQRHLELLPRLVQCIHNPDLCRTACEVLSHVATHPEVHRWAGHPRQCKLLALLLHSMLYLLHGFFTVFFLLWYKACFFLFQEMDSESQFKLFKFYGLTGRYRV